MLGVSSHRGPSFDGSLMAEMLERIVFSRKKLIRGWDTQQIPADWGTIVSKPNSFQQSPTGATKYESLITLDWGARTVAWSGCCHHKLSLEARAKPMLKACFQP